MKIRGIRIIHGNGNVRMKDMGMEVNGNDMKSHGVFRDWFTHLMGMRFLFQATKFLIRTLSHGIKVPKAQ